MRHLPTVALYTLRASKPYPLADKYRLVANVLGEREDVNVHFCAFHVSTLKLTKAIYALYSHAQLPGAGLLDREGWPEARSYRGRALPRPRGGLNTADSDPLWARDGPVRGLSMVRRKA